LTSILFPFHAQAGHGIRVREAPLERIADCMTSASALVAVSAVQSADGRGADVDALHAASRATGTNVLLDTTQAVGWLPVDASRFAYTACGGCKWLLSPQRRRLLHHQPRADRRPDTALRGLVRRR
jgi:selenocysteine lyase/cysteine desulfurase